MSEPAISCDATGKNCEPTAKALQERKPECPIVLEPMAKWAGAEQKGDSCRPCAIPVAVSWYLEELEERGKTDLKDKLTTAQKTGNAVAVGQAMDEVKDQADPDLKLRLLEFDCQTQIFAAEEEGVLQAPEDSPESTEPPPDNSGSVSGSPTPP